MPLYLSEELSPRFSRAKVVQAWKLKHEKRIADGKAHVEAAINAWRANGKDRYLREIADSNAANLRGVPIKPRSEREVREAAEIEWRILQEKELRAAAKKLKLGWLWDQSRGTKGGYAPGPKVLRREAKLASKQAKAARMKDRLATMQMGPAKNMEVPKEIRKPRVRTAKGETTKARTTKAKISAY
jgi:large subunit ribosomal protein L24